MIRKSFSFIVALGAAGLMVCGGGSLQAQEAERPTIAILPFDRESQPSPESARADRGKATRSSVNNKIEGDIYQCVVESFFNLKRFRIIERAQLDQVLQEGKFQASGVVDEASAVKLGKQMGAKFIVLGSFTADTRLDHRDRELGAWYESTIRLNLRMVSTESGSVENVFSTSGRSMNSNDAEAQGNAVKLLAKDTSRQISNSYPLSGYIIQVSNEKEAVLDLGKKDGVSSGDIFVAFEQGADIVHPVTGKRIKGAKRQISEFKVVSASDETSIVKLIGDKIAMKPGIMLESKPRTGGLFESLRNSMK